MNLASTVWPRSGYDSRNSSRVSVAGPTEGRVRLRMPLPIPHHAAPEDQHRPFFGAGTIVRSDGSLVVINGRVLSCWTKDGELLWSTDLIEHGKLPVFHSAPVALSDGSVLVTLKSSYVVVDAEGRLKQQVNVQTGMDDSGFAPNITPSGLLITTSQIGRVAVRLKYRWKEVGYFGYDIVPPAVYDDESLAICGYAGSGLCRVDLNGHIVWQQDFDADLLASINSQQILAAGSLNNGRSLFVTPQGETLGEYGAAALFAEHFDNTWIARSENSVGRITNEGIEVWTCSIETPEHWSTKQPIVDKDGCVYLTVSNAVVCYDADGAVVFTHTEEGGQPIGLSPIGENELTYIVGDECVLMA